MALDAHSASKSIGQLIAEAETLVVKRMHNGGMAITVDDMTISTVDSPKAFITAIAGLVMKDVSAAHVSRVVMRRVSPQIMFDCARMDFFNISFLSVNDDLLGGRETLKGQVDVAKILTAKLSPV